MKQIKDILGKKNRKSKNIHTSRHALAEEMTEYFNEPKDYRKYLGVCHQHPEEELRRLFSEIKQEEKRNPKISPVKLFFFKLKQIEKIHGKRKNENISERRKSA